MEPKMHGYVATVRWDAPREAGNADYRGYTRSHTITSGAKPPILGSADPAFLGHAERWNPEDLLVAAASACHKLWYLDLSSRAGIVVRSYTDHAEGYMVDGPPGEGRFIQIVLRPRVEIDEGCDLAQAHELHKKAHSNCYIANSLSFPIRCEPTVVAASSAPR